MTNYYNILQTTFALKDPKSAKRQGWLDCLFALLESELVKAACKHVGEIDPKWLIILKDYFSTLVLSYLGGSQHVKNNCNTIFPVFFCERVFP